MGPTHKLEHLSSTNFIRVIKVNRKLQHFGNDELSISLFFFFLREIFGLVSKLYLLSMSDLLSDLRKSLCSSSSPTLSARLL